MRFDLHCCQLHISERAGSGWSQYKGGGARDKPHFSEIPHAFGSTQRPFLNVHLFIILIGVEVEFLPIGFIVSFGGEMFLLSDVIISFVLLYYLLQKL